MDLHERLENAEQEGFELHKAFSAVDHRVRELDEHRELLKTLKAQIQFVRQDVDALMANLSLIQQHLPSVARKEEIEQLSRKLDSIPFEILATRRDVR